MKEDEEFLEELKLLFKLLIKVNKKLKRKKCYFASGYLGNVIRKIEKGIRINEE